LRRLCLPGFFAASLILFLDYKGVHPHQETFFSLSIWTPHQSPERYGLLLHDSISCSVRAFSAGNEHSPLWLPVVGCIQPPYIIINRDKKSSTTFPAGPAEPSFSWRAYLSQIPFC
jgi:hypothetical protein